MDQPKRLLSQSGHLPSMSVLRNTRRPIPFPSPRVYPISTHQSALASPLHPTHPTPSHAMSSRRSERSRRPPTPSDAHYEPPAVSRAPPSVVGAGAGEAGHAPLVLDHLDPSVSSGNGTTQPLATTTTTTTTPTASTTAAKPTTPASTANRVTGRGKNWRLGIKGDIRFATRDKVNEQIDVVYGTERPLPAKRRYPKTSSQGDAASPAPAPSKRKKGKKSAEVKNDPPREDAQQQRAGTPVRKGTPPREPTPEKPKEPWEIEDPVWTEFSQEYYEGACRVSRIECRGSGLMDQRSRGTAAARDSSKLCAPS